jgi:hypothetical protein
MHNSEQIELISPCGMNCSICVSYLAMKNQLKNKGVKMAYCQGCRQEIRIALF